MDVEDENKKDGKGAAPSKQIYFNGGGRGVNTGSMSDQWCRVKREKGRERERERERDKERGGESIYIFLCLIKIVYTCEIGDEYKYQR